MTDGRPLGKRLAVAAIVAAVIVLVGGIAPTLSPAGGGIQAGPDHPEYDAERIAPERLESQGEPSPDGSVGTVLFDRSHGNRFDQEDITSLIRAIDDAGGEVRYTGITTGFQAQLAEADVLVVIDPGQSYDDDDIEAIESFVDDGGRLLVLGEPNRKEVEQSGLFVQLVTVRSELKTLGSSFGITFGNEYLYDMENNDGNFKNPVAAPPSGTDADAVADVDEVAMYTAASVHVNRGTVLLRTAGTAERGSDTTTRGFPVAVQTRNGDVMAVGDTTFMETQYDSVADNDVFIERIVEFMTGADHQGSPGPQDETEEPTAPSVARPVG
jgi:hypothetical protein